MEKIPGPALCGFADYFDDDYDDTVVGAKGKPGKPGKSVGPPTGTRYPKPKQSSTIATHAKVLKHARQVLSKAHGQVKKAAQRTIAKPTPVKPSGIASRFGVVIHGDEYVVVGASKVPPQQQPKVRAAMAKLAKAKENVKKLAAAAVPKIKAAHASVVRLASQVKNHENVARKLSGKGTHGVHGIGADAAGYNPGDPNYDATSDPSSPQYIDPNAGTNPAYADPTAPTDASTLDLDTLVTAATAAGKLDMGTLIPDFTMVPAIKYDGSSKGTPDGYVLSYGLATRATDIQSQAPKTAGIDPVYHYGYVWGNYYDEHAEKGIPFGNTMGGSGKWNHLKGRYVLGDFRAPAGEGRADTDNTDGHSFVDVSEAYASSSKMNPNGVSYGPLVGNPALKDFANMRVDLAGNMFWLANEAPDYVTYPLKAQAALTKAAADKAAKDAAAADAAAQAKLAADNAATQAAQDAQNALDEANAASQGRQASSAAQATADTADAASAQADAQAAAADAAQAQADAEASRGQQQQDLAERQWQFQQAQEQARQDVADRAAQQQYQQQLPPQPQGGDGGGGDEVDNSPEAAADEEAANIENDTEVLGQVLPPIVGDDDVVGGDGEVIGFDNFGNHIE